MKTRTLSLSWFVRAIAMVGLLFIAVCYTCIANAAQGCGQGLHRAPYGGCVWNHPGRYATPAPAHPGCWRNGYGQLRCYRGY